MQQQQQKTNDTYNYCIKVYYILFIILHGSSFSAVKAGSVLMDCSTIDPTVSQAMAGIAQEKGAMFVDAPVSGGKVKVIGLSSVQSLVRIKNLFERKIVIIFLPINLKMCFGAQKKCLI